jgi:hypothetical protein
MPNNAYGAIFGLEAFGLLIAALIAFKVSASRFRETRVPHFRDWIIARAMDGASCGVVRDGNASDCGDARQRRATSSVHSDFGHHLF